MELVELAIKSIDVPALPTTGPAASVSFVTEPAVTEGIVASAGPPGLEPPIATSISRALSFEATQLRKNAAQSACLALAAIPYVNGADIAAGGSPALTGGIRKNPMLPAISLSYPAFCQSPLNVKTPSPLPKRAAASVYSMALMSGGK